MDNLSREKLSQNPEFVNKAKGVLYDTFGETHAVSTKEEVLDDFYSKFRDVDWNMLDAYRLWSTTTSELDENQKKELKEVYDVYRALPSFWEDDSASNVQGFWDITSALFSDPATYLGIATGGIASVATKTAAYGAVKAGLKSSLEVGRRATINSALTGISTDVVSNVLGDAALQGAERQINYREDGYDFGQGALAAAAAIIPGAAIGVSGTLLKKLSKSDEMLETVAQGKQIYLEGSEAGKAFLEGKTVAGSFVQVTDKNILKGDSVDRMAYVDSIDTTKNTYILNVGFDDTGNAITKEVGADKIKLVDPFDKKVSMKMERQISNAGKIYNTERAKLGYETFQKEMKENLKASGMSDEALEDIAEGTEFVLSDVAVTRVNKAFLDIIQEAQISYNPNKAISVMVEDVLAGQHNGFSAEDFVKIMKSNGVSNIEMLAVMKGESLAGAYRGTVFKAASTLGKLSGLSRKARQIAIEKELDVSFGGNFTKITGGPAGLRTEADFSKIKDGRQYAKEVLGTTELNKETEAYYTSLLAERTNIDRFTKVFGKEGHRGDQWNRMVRLGMIAQPATTIRNVMGGLIRSPMDATTRTIDNILTYALQKTVAGVPTIRPVNISDGFEHLSSMVAPQEYEAMAKLIMSKKPMAKELIKGPEGYMEALKVAQTMNGDKTGVINKIYGYVADPLEKTLIHANVLNSIQDRYMKSQSFIVGLRQSMSRASLDLDDMIRKGKIQDIPDANIADGMQWAMEYNYQANIRGDFATTRFAIETLNKISNIPFLGSSLVPFPKFMINSIKFMYEHAPILGSADLLVGRKGVARAFGKEGNQYLQQQAIKRISQQGTGAALLTLAYAIRTSEVGGEHWDEIMDGNGNIQNIGTWYPLAPALWLADGIVQLGDQGRNFYVLPNRKVVRERNDFKTQWWEDTAKALGGPSSRAGVWKELDKNFIEAFFGGDVSKVQLLQNGLGIAMGNVISAMLTPLKLVKDVVDETNFGGFDENARLFHDARSSEGFTDNFLSQIFKNVPMGHSFLKSPYSGVTRLKDGTLVYEETTEYKYDKSSGNTAVPRLKYSVLNAKPLVNVSPLYKQFTGTFRLRKRNVIEKEFARLGIPEWRLFKKTNIPEYDRALKMIQGGIVERVMSNYMFKDKYLQWNDSGKDAGIKRVLGRIRGKVAESFHSTFHLGMLGALNKQPKYARNQAYRMLQDAGTFPKDNDYDVGLGFELNKAETAMLLEITKRVKSFKNL